MTFIKICGIFGVFVLFVSLVLLVTGVVLLWMAETRRTMAVFLVVSLLPLMLGLAGTMIGYHRVDMVAGRLEKDDADKEEIVELGRKHARYTTYLGIGTSAVLLCLGAAGLLTKTGRPQDPDAP